MNRVYNINVAPEHFQDYEIDFSVLIGGLESHVVNL